MKNKEKYLLFKQARDWGTDGQGKPLSYQAMRSDPSMSHMSDFGFKNWARTKGHSPVGTAGGAAAGVPNKGAAPVAPAAPAAPAPAPAGQAAPASAAPMTQAQQMWNSKGGDPSVIASPSPGFEGGAQSSMSGSQAKPLSSDPFANGASPTMYSPQQMVAQNGLPGVSTGSKSIY